MIVVSGDNLISYTCIDGSKVTLIELIDHIRLAFPSDIVWNSLHTQYLCPLIPKIHASLPKNHSSGIKGQTWTCLPSHKKPQPAVMTDVLLWLWKGILQSTQTPCSFMWACYWSSCWCGTIVIEQLYRFNTEWLLDWAQWNCATQYGAIVLYMTGLPDLAVTLYPHSFLNYILCSTVTVVVLWADRLFSFRSDQLQNINSGK